MSRWPTVPLGEVLTPVSRPESVQPERNYRILGAHWYAGGLYVKHEALGAEIRAAKVYRVEEGDFVYNRLFAWKGSFAIATKENHGCYVSNEFPCFGVAAERLDPQYLQYYFSRQAAWSDALALSAGGTPTSRNRLKESALLAMLIPKPPIDVQRHRVAQTATIMALLREAARGRAAAVWESKALAQSRKRDLLTDVVSEKIPIGEIAEVRGGIQKHPERMAANNPVRYLTVAHVQRNRISLDDPRFFEVRPEELDRWRLAAGDVLIIEGNGSADQIGRTALFRGEIEPCVHQNHVIRIRPDRARIEPEFLNLYLNSPIGQEAVQSQSRTTSGLRSLSVGRIKAIKVRVPSVESQRRIVDRAREFEDLVHRLVESQEAARKEIDALTPAVLDRAFRD